MPHFQFRNVNDAFRRLTADIADNQLPTVRTSSRVGDVIQITQPVTITYGKPLERVLFNPTRDANPFFHLMEALWMLAGRDDIASPTFYAANYSEQVKDKGSDVANGAYGYRWRRYGRYRMPIGIDDVSQTGVDQLPLIIDQLKRKPASRRVVLQMWNVEDDLLKIDTSKDVCCNTHAYFLINSGRLDMTVCNRSNDMIWGALGANVVHFAFLQEYLAAHIGVPVGVYNQFTNNLHVYTDRWEPEKWLSDPSPDYYNEGRNGGKRVVPFPLIQKPDTFELELTMFVDGVMAKEMIQGVKGDYREAFLKDVAWPMAQSFLHHRRRDYDTALRYVEDIAATDWKRVAESWIRKRAQTYLAKKGRRV